MTAVISSWDQEKLHVYFVDPIPRIRYSPRQMSRTKRFVPSVEEKKNRTRGEMRMPHIIILDFFASKLKDFIY